jgi:superfamily II RNA helicase
MAPNDLTRLLEKAIDRFTLEMAELRAQVVELQRTQDVMSSSIKSERELEALKGEIQKREVDLVNMQRGNDEAWLRLHLRVLTGAVVMIAVAAMPQLVAFIKMVKGALP